MKKSNNFILRKVKLILYFSLISFVIATTSMSAILMFFRFVQWVDFLDFEMLPAHIEQAVLVAISLVIGIILALLFRRFILKPLYSAYYALNCIAEGNYDVEIKPQGIRAIAKVAREINSTAKELRSIEIMRNDFINNFSHEFRTPIVSIEGFAKILKDENLSPEEKEEYLNIIISESHRLSELSSNILILNRLDNQNVLSDKKIFNISEQIRLCVVLLENKWSQKDISFDFSGDDYEFNGSEQLLQQLWLNIIDNAIKYSPCGGEIFIRVFKRNGNLFFTFTDKGKGMTEHELKHAFDRFYQGDINHKNSGNGIGLSVSKKICELHGGKIAITSEPDNSTTVEITLPL